MKPTSGPILLKKLSNKSRRVRGRLISGILLFIAALYVSACSISPSAFLKTRPLEADQVVATDARVRGLVTKGIGAFSISGSVDPKTITCTEPSPDVATSIATVLSGSVNVFSKGSGSLTASQVEGLVQLGEKTAAIQLLRDKMYQTCLAYSNGAISGTTYSLIMSRLDDTIITMLLGETAAGAFGREGARSGGSATASLGVPSVAELQAQTDKLVEANKQLDAARKATPLDPNVVIEKEEARDKEYQALQRLKSSAGLAQSQISNASGSGSLSPAPEAAVANSLLAMQRGFLIDDLGRAYVQSCLIELGQRGPVESANKLAGTTKVVRPHATARFEDISPSGKEQMVHQLAVDVRNLVLTPNSGHAPSNYVSAVLRARGSELAAHCKTNLREVIDASLVNEEAARKDSIEQWSKTENARYDGIAARYKKEALDALNTVLKSCKESHSGDDEAAGACRSAAYAILTAAD